MEVQYLWKSEGGVGAPGARVTQAVMSYPTQAQGTEFRSSAKTVPIHSR